jgi:hypothetical protein
MPVMLATAPLTAAFALCRSDTPLLPLGTSPALARQTIRRIRLLYVHEENTIGAVLVGPGRFAVRSLAGR